jgi:hypothetical protein
MNGLKINDKIIRCSQMRNNLKVLKFEGFPLDLDEYDVEDLFRFRGSAGPITFVSLNRFKNFKDEDESKELDPSAIENSLWREFNSIFKTNIEFIEKIEVPVQEPMP